LNRADNGDRDVVDDAASGKHQRTVNNEDDSVLRTTVGVNGMVKPVGHGHSLELIGDLSALHPNLHEGRVGGVVSGSVITYGRGQVLEKGELDICSAGQE
jgi:hypothetical protein